MDGSTDEPGNTEIDVAGLVRFRLDLGYDGTEFSGWARQPGRRTVQGELETALGVVLRLEPPPALTVAGRTDAGVHARGQVAHVDLPASALSPVIMHVGATRPPAGCAYVHDHREVDGELPGLVRRLNGVLAPDVRLRGVRLAPPDFDARFSALSRRYSYRVADGWLDPLRRRDTLTHPRALDVQAMNAAAAQLLGEHDFAAYCRRREGASTIRRLLDLSWQRDPAGVAVATVEADAFCHSMVRALVGALLAVGDGRRDADWPARVLAAGARDAAVGVVAARGLVLEQVSYPDDDQLAARARQTRNLRASGATA